MAPHQIQRRQFTELHPKDQTIKVNRKTRIESNWTCNIQECLPLHLRPRMELKKGAKARIGDVGVAEEVWWNWSVELLRSLEELSTMTSTKLSFAQELLHLEVTQRQQNPKHPQRKIVEVLLGDVQRVIDGMRRNQHEEADQQAGGEMEEDNIEEDGEAYWNEEAEQHNSEADAKVDNTMFSNASTNAQGDSTRSLAQHAYQATPPTAGRSSHKHRQATTPSYRVEKSGRRATEFEVRAIEIRARAVRLRAQATRLEADAVELEADAADVRAAMSEGPSE